MGRSTTSRDLRTAWRNQCAVSGNGGLKRRWKPDLVLTDADDKGNGIIEVLLNEGDRFPTRVKYLSGVFGSSVTLGDVNGNGKPDAIVASAVGSVAILSGNGNGTFSKAVLIPRAGLAGNSPWFSVAAIGDLNGDGTPDLVISGRLSSAPQNGKVAVLYKQRGWNFQGPDPYGTGGLNHTLWLSQI